MIPQVSKRIKEWAYAGFAFDFIFAGISHFAIDGMNFQSFFPFIFLAILTISYYCYHKLQARNPSSNKNTPSFSLSPKAVI
jgi:hypothetical protein